MRLTTWRAISGRPCFAHRLPRKQRRDGSDGFRVPDGFAELLARQPQEPPRLHRERVKLRHQHAVDQGLALVDFSAQLERSLCDRGCA
jgi:hypothetical protein